jgi:hypothetical protein
VQGLSILTIGVLYALGVRRRWPELDGKARYDGVLHAMRGVVGVCVLGSVACVALRGPQSMNDAWPIAYVSLAGILGARLLARALKPRIVREAHA